MNNIDLSRPWTPVATTPALSSLVCPLCGAQGNEHDQETEHCWGCGSRWDARFMRFTVTEEDVQNMKNYLAKGIDDAS